MTEIVAAIPSSFVKKRLKLKDEKGSGESKLFIGSRNNENKYDHFFNNFDSSNKYYFLKSDLTDYLKYVKIEFLAQKCNQYKNLNMESYANKKILASIQKETNNIVTAYREIVNLSKSMLERPISKLYQLFKILQYAMLFNLFLSFIILCFKKDKSISLEIYYRNKFRLATIFATLSFSVYLIFKIFIDISLFFPLFFVLFFLQSLFYASKYSRCI